MAYITTRTQVCDVCASPDELTEYSLSRTGRPKRVALCPLHAAPLEEILSPGTSTAKATTGRRKRPSRPATMAEVKAAANG